MSKIAYINEELQEIAADLPTTYATRWNKARKAAVVRAVEAGVIGIEKALAVYRLSLAEFAGWQRDYEASGVRRLPKKRLQAIA